MADDSSGGKKQQIVIPQNLTSKGRGSKNGILFCPRRKKERRERSVSSKGKEGRESGGTSMGAILPESWGKEGGNRFG